MFNEGNVQYFAKVFKRGDPDRCDRGGHLAKLVLR